MLGRTLTKLLLVDFAVAMLVTQLGVAGLYIVVDLFERLDVIVRNDVSTAVVGVYFLYKLPLIAYQTVPAATAIALVTTLIQRQRHREIIALSSAGITRAQIALPFILAAALLSAGSLFWSELIVPPTIRAAQEVNLREIKKRDRRNIFADREIWLRGPSAIYHVSYIDRQTQTLLGVTSYELANDFSLTRIRYFPEIRWTQSGWVVSTSQEHVVVSWTSPSQETGEVNLQLPSRFEELAEVQREPEELSLADLRRQEQSLRALGLPVTRLSVEVYLKTALPFAPLAIGVALTAFNLSLKRSRHVGWTVMGSAAIGFGYWLLLGIASSLGHAGSLPPLVAAWLANCTYIAAGTALLLGPEAPPKSV